VGYAALLPLAREIGFDLTHAHGAEGGFDPYQATHDLDDTNFFGYIHGEVLPPSDPGEWAQRCFYATFGMHKTVRIGGENTAHATALNPPDFSEESFAALAVHRTEQRAYMDREFYGRLIDESRHRRVVIVASYRGNSIVMSRLLEVYARTPVAERPADLRNIVFVMQPWDDEIQKAGGSEDIAAALTVERRDEEVVAAIRRELSEPTRPAEELQALLSTNPRASAAARELIHQHALRRLFDTYLRVYGRAFDAA
jgi:hypothetical protein